MVLSSSRPICGSPFTREPVEMTMPLAAVWYVAPHLHAVLPESSFPLPLHHSDLVLLHQELDALGVLIGDFA